MTIYYVDGTSGSDSNTGLSDAQAWKTIGKVNGSSFSTSDQIYLKCGTTFTDAALTIDWSGTSGNRVIFGAYYLSGGVETIGVSGSKPVIDRGWDGTTYTVCTVYDAAVTVSNPYVTVQDIKVANMKGRAYQVQSGASSGPAIFSNIDADTIFNEALVCDFNSGNGTTIQDCTFTTIVKAKILGCFPSGGWPSGINTTNTQSGTVQRCTINKCGGEGMIVTTGWTAQDNEICNARALGIYVSDKNNCTFRRNLIYGTTDTSYQRSGGAAGAGIGVADETGTTGYSGHVIYNNLVAFCGAGMQMDGTSSVAGSSILIYHNTFVDCNTGFEVFGTNFSSCQFKNNIIADYTGTDTMSGTVPASGITCDYNMWHRSAEANAQGAHDPSVGDPKLSKTSGWRSITALGDIVATNFNLTAGSPCIDTALDIATYSDTDYFQVTRVTPDIGGTEFVAAVTIPVIFYSLMQ